MTRSEDGGMISEKGSDFWQSGSSLKPAPSRCSLRSTGIVLPEGRATEFATMHGAYHAPWNEMSRSFRLLGAEHTALPSQPAR